MMSCNVLIVDDDKDFLEITSRYLRNNNFIVFSAQNVKEALTILSKKKIQLIISDVDMPGINGFEFLKSVRESRRYSNIPFILMSGKKITELDMLEGYNKGSDDYIIKPFSFPLLIAKIKNILKRAGVCENGKIIRISDMEIDVSAKSVSVGKKKVMLTKKEFELLLTLAKNKNNVFSPSQLLEIVWGYDTTKIDDPHTVETHISSLRKKLGTKISKKIKNISGYGYKFEL
ncbi:MAG: response regulator transcription factor [Elusimicrobiota bacterium]